MLLCQQESQEAFEMLALIDSKTAKATGQPTFRDRTPKEEKTH
jgi:hypothetical protein